MICHPTAAQQFTSREEKNHVNRNQMPVPPCRRRRHVEPRLVAEPVEARPPAPAFLQVRSDGRGLQLRRGVQEPRPGGGEERSRGADDRLAGLVAGGLRPLRAAVHSHGVAQRRHLPHRRRPRRRAAGASSASRRSTVGRTTSAWTRRAGCSGRSSRSMAARFPGPT